MNRYFIILIIAVAVRLTASPASAGTAFRYDYKENKTLHYKVMINSKIKFEELGSLAQLLNLDNVANNVEMLVDLNVITAGSTGTALINVEFKKISMVTVAGDSVFTDNGSNWGAIKPGSLYSIEVNRYGEIMNDEQIDSLGGKQAVQLVQRFFPQFPDSEIEPGYEWSDSLDFDLQMPGDKPTEIQSQMTYLYVNKELDNGYRFDYEASGVSHDIRKIDLSGDGHINFDNKEGRLKENSGNFKIDAQLELSSLGFPQGLGTIPVHIESTIEIKLNNAE